MSNAMTVGDAKVTCEVADNGYLNFFIEGENMKMEVYFLKLNEINIQESSAPPHSKHIQKAPKKEGKADKPENKSENTLVNLHKLEIETVPSSFTKEEYDIYFKYQTTIHKEKASEVSEKGYTSKQLLNEI